jgi:PAS domain S-box-containing protein
MSQYKSKTYKGSPKFPAFKISLIYFVVSFFWILFSDNLLTYLTPNFESYVIFSTYKGTVFVLITTLLIYSLIRSTARKISSKQKEYFIQQFKIEEKLGLANEILERVNSIVLVADSNGSVIYASPSVKDILGYSNEELLGDGWWNAIWQDKNLREFEKNCVIQFASGERKIQPKPYERQVKNKAGKRMWFLWQDAHGSNNTVIGIAHNITDLKIAEDMQKESENKYELIFGHSPVGIFLYNMKLVIVDCNDKFSEVLNVPKDILIGLDMNNLKDKSILPSLRKSITGTEGNYEGLYKATNSDTEIWIQMLTAPLKDPYENVKGGIGIVNDISERIEAAESIRKNEESYKAFITQSIEGIYRMELKEPVDTRLPVQEQLKKIYENSYLAECNLAMAKMYGFGSIDELIGKTYLDFQEKQHDPVNTSRMIRFIESGYRTDSEESREIDKNKNIKFILNNAVGIIENGKLFRIWGTQTDVTELRAKQEQIRKLSHAVEQSPNAIVIANSDRKIEYLNSKFTNVTGYKHIEIIGKDMLLLTPLDLSRDEFTEMWNLVLQGNQWTGEFINKRKNGEKFSESISISPIKDDGGDVTHFLLIIEDISLRKLAEKELLSAKEKAEEMNKLKSNFLANMSHELRTPLTGILGFTELIYNAIDDPNIKEMANIILKGSRRLNDTLNSLLDLSRIESNKMDLNIKLVNIGKAISDTGKFFLLSTKEKKIEFKILPLKPKIYANIDENIFNQILSNLINNAVKFTKKGSVTVTSDLIDDIAGKKAVIKIIDTGIGITEKNMKMIFEPFRQVSEGLSRTYEGTGLGLTITKKFVEIMGGSISVESEFGKGTTFTVIFPAFDPDFIVEKEEKKETKTTDKKNYESLKDKQFKIMVIEDDEINKKMVRIFLKGIYYVEDAGDEEEALILAGSKQFDIILLDINLRGKDGIEALKKIRKIPGYKNVPVVAMTAYSMLGDKERFLHMGCDYYISKPYTKETLKGTLETIIKTIEVS